MRIKRANHSIIVNPMTMFIHSDHGNLDPDILFDKDLWRQWIQICTVANPGDLDPLDPLRRHTSVYEISQAYKRTIKRLEHLWDQRLLVKIRSVKIFRCSDYLMPEFDVSVSDSKIKCFFNYRSSSHYYKLKHSAGLAAAKEFTQHF